MHRLGLKFQESTIELNFFNKVWARNDVSVNENCTKISPLNKNWARAKLLHLEQRWCCSAPTDAKLETHAIAWRLSEPGIRSLIYLKSMPEYLSLMNQIVWLSAGTWQHTLFVSVKRLPKAVSFLPPLCTQGLPFCSGFWVRSSSCQAGVIGLQSQGVSAEHGTCPWSVGRVACQQMLWKGNQHNGCLKGPPSGCFCHWQTSRAMHLI